MKVLLLFCLTALILCATSQAHAQVADTLRPDPNVRPLRKIWVKEGERAYAKFGYAFGGIGDIYGISRSAWAISSDDPREWRIYTWDTTAHAPRLMQTIPGLGSMKSTPVVGDFYGSGFSLTGLPTGYLDSTVTRYNTQLYFFRSDSNRLDTVPSLVYNSLTKGPLVSTEPDLFIAADLDADGADELIMFTIGVRRDTVQNRTPEIWIYKGGPDFQVDTPTVILHDTEPNGGRGYYALYVGDFDGDHLPDIVTCSDYYDALGLQKLKFYFSHNGSPWNWTTPEREVLLKNLSRPIPVALDCTGDSVLDLAMARTARVDLYRSNVGKDIHTRSFDSTDADNVYLSSGLIFPDRFGYLNDSSRRYEMLDIVAGSDLGLSGAPTGPDAHYKTINGDILARAASVGDVTGDGWDDLLSASPGYDFGTGVVNLFAGGPYIPRDPALGVRTVATLERPDAVYVWPNPLHTDLHIAWRGDLRQMPRHFVVHDLLGRAIDHGSVESGRGEIVWQAERYPAGTYLVSLLAADGSMIVTLTIHKD